MLLNNAAATFNLHDSSNVTLSSNAQITLSAGAATAYDSSAIISTTGSISVSGVGSTLKMTTNSQLLGTTTSVLVSSGGTLSLELQSRATLGQTSIVNSAAGGSVYFRYTSSSLFQTGSSLTTTAGLIQLEGRSSVTASDAGTTVVASGTGSLKTTLNSNLNVLNGASLQVNNANLMSDGSSKVTVDGCIAQVGTGGQVTIASSSAFQAQNSATLIWLVVHRPQLPTTPKQWSRVHRRWI